MTAVYPVRLRLSRTPGFDLQRLSRETNGLEAVVVTRSSKLGNPFVVGVDGTQEECCELYAHLVIGRICLASKATPAAQWTCLEATDAAMPRLAGRNIACSCRFDGKPCHGGILLIVANLSPAARRRYGLTDRDALLRAAGDPDILRRFPER